MKSVDSKLTLNDHFLHFKLRLGIGRNDHAVKPGIYAHGNPNKSSPLFVSSNYKMSFNVLRSALNNIDCWILVIDTKGINVWCAAGKGIFETDEIIRKIKRFKVSEIIDHRNLILPQLSATGVSAHRVKEKSGFNVIYGPVRAKDINAFLANKRRATETMRRVKFTLFDRIVLTPVEFFQALKYFVLLIFVFFLASKIGNLKDHDIENSFKYYFIILFPVLSLVAGSVITPLLLPYIPFRSFTLKGFVVGIALFTVASLVSPIPAVAKFGSILLFPALSAFLGLNFTGSSTYTSPSGVRKEMKMFIRPILAISIAGFVLILFYLIN